MKIKIGDKVRINPKSEFYGDGNSNPTDRTGVVIKHDGGKLGIWVEWGHPYENNTYDNADLILLNSDKNDAVSDTTDDDSKENAGKQK